MPEELEAGGRRHTRIQYRAATVAIRNKATGPFFPGDLLDISAGGCLISMPASFAISSGEVIYVRLDLQSLIVCTLGFVRHVKKDNTLGVEFHRMSETDRSELTNFVNYFADAQL